MAKIGPKEAATRRILRRIRHEYAWALPPIFVGMRFIRHVREGRGQDADFEWAVYISHDPCHDSPTRKADRNTVIAFHRTRGEFRILGRELDLEYAEQLAAGEV